MRLVPGVMNSSRSLQIEILYKHAHVYDGLVSLSSANGGVQPRMLIQCVSDSTYLRPDPVGR